MFNDGVKMKRATSAILCMMLAFLIANSVFAGVLEDAEKYAVRVKASISYPFAEDDEGTFNGAGFLIDKNKSWFLTNAHVSGRGSGDIEISFKGQEFVEAELIYVDPDLDFSILSIEKQSIPDFAIEANLDCEGKQLSGAEVAAFGHPHDLYYSASRGIVSKVRFYDGLDWIQLDAAINPGNSGGPLIDIKTGKVIGINAMALENSEGLNFAVPMQPVCKAVELLKKDKDPSPPQLPLSFASDDVLEKYLTVAGNRFGPLPDGIEIGDVLITVNEIDVKTPTEVTTILRGFEGDATFIFERSNKQIYLKLGSPKKSLITEREYIYMDGAVIAEDFYVERFAREQNYMFHSVRDGSYADRVGFSEREIIISVDGVKPKSIIHLKELLSGETEKKLITRHWSAIENQFYEFFVIDYVPNYLEAF